MALLEDDTQVFIVRIWLEAREIDDAPLAWRGVIEHVPSGRRGYLKRLEGIAGFIVPYLREMGVEMGLRWRVGEMLERWKRRGRSE
jgi:hypothetical protein